MNSPVDTILITNCEESAAKTADESNHNTENGEDKVANEIGPKEDNANDVVDKEKENNQKTVDTGDEVNQLGAVRDVIVELKDMYNEFLLKIKLVQKDLVRSAKYDELESKVICLFECLKIHFINFLCNVPQDCNQMSHFRNFN